MTAEINVFLVFIEKLLVKKQKQMLSHPEDCSRALGQQKHVIVYCDKTRWTDSELVDTACNVCV